MIKILTADDGPLIRAGIKTVISWNDHSLDVIGEVSDGNEAYEKTLALKPGILITDIKMPGVSSITLLKKLKQEKVSIQSMMLDCFDELELVREAMKYSTRGYILKLSTDLAKILEVLGEIRQDLTDLPENEPYFSLNADDLKYPFIKKLQNRGFTSDEQVEDVLHNIQLTTSLKNYYLIRFTSEPGIARISDDNRRKMICNLSNQLYQRYPGNELLSLDEKGYPIIQNAEENDFLCCQVSAAMEQCVNQTIYFGISLRLKDYSALKNGLRQADDTLNTCAFYEETEPLTPQMFASAGFSFIISCLAQRPYISLFSDNTEKSCELVSCFLFWLKSGLSFPSLCYSYLEEILNIYVRVAREQNFSIYQMQDGEADVFGRICQMYTLRSCEQVLFGFTRRFTEFIREKRSGERSEILKIKEYLQPRYSENTDLSLIAELVNTTPSHLSSLFKKETGVNFSTYLTDVWMKAAGKLLQLPEFLVYEVVERAGYSNTGHSGETFEKYWGISPEEFKKEQHQGFTYYTSYQCTYQAILRDVQYAL